MTLTFCDVCGGETTHEPAVLPPVGIATVNGKGVRLNLDRIRDDLGWPIEICSGCLILAVDCAEWNVDPSEVIKEPTKCSNGLKGGIVG